MYYQDGWKWAGIPLGLTALMPWVFTADAPELLDWTALPPAAIALAVAGRIALPIQTGRTGRTGETPWCAGPAVHSSYAGNWVTV
ncbi:hypothetical protein D3867_23865 (plasmid) [Azospirillum argentinense]|uniref:Uncharacterized protein n=2 Tax=Azospirillum TaxID=191 RepID=A0A4D8PZ69_AZOBR|nr:hypothetical protein D3867_14515 [Azospirillum argentinense]QCO04896.1 hypothetical protein D3867_23865 [Azospirillum argentinense]